MSSTSLTPAQTGYIAGTCQMTGLDLSVGPPPLDPADTRNGSINIGFRPCHQPVLPHTAGLSEAALYDLYANFVKWHGDSRANAALAAGQQVILGLRIETSTRVNQGLGLYHDRVAVIWQDLPPKPSPQMLPTANVRHAPSPAQLLGRPIKHGFDFIAATQPSAQYEDPGTTTITSKKNGKVITLKVPNKIIGPDGQAVIPRNKWEGNDVNHDGRQDLGRLVPGTYEFHFATGERRLKFGYEHLRGNTQQVVQRDVNHDGYFTAADVWHTPSGDTVIEVGDFAILFHRGGDDNTWSGGCQTMPAHVFAKFLSKLNRSQSSYYYVLVTLR